MSSSSELYPSVTPTQNTVLRHGRSMSNQSAGESYNPKDALRPPTRDGRSMSNSSAMFGPRGSSLAPSGPPPGSFSSDLKTTAFPRVTTPKKELGQFFSNDYVSTEAHTTSEKRQLELKDAIRKEEKYKVGSEKLIEALQSKSTKRTKDQRAQAESALDTSRRIIEDLKSQLKHEISFANRPSTPPRNRLSDTYQASPVISPSRDERDSQTSSPTVDTNTQAPTYLAGEILQALEAEGMQSDYYVDRGNRLVDLFKTYPTLKYDLAWPTFGARVQMMLLSESREVVAAGFRVTRHAIADRKTLRNVRELHTDILIILSLVKESKASIEREQALKLVRAFIDVKDGAKELSRAVVRTVVAVAEHHEDRLRNMALLTLSEILARNPSVVVASGGISVLTDILSASTYPGSEGLAITFLHVLDKPQQRTLLRSGYELASIFTPFTEPAGEREHEEKLKSSAKLICALLKTWPGLITFSNANFLAIRSLVQCLYSPTYLARDLILDLLFDVLNIKPPSWTSSFLAGRRLTTYGRVANLKSEDHIQSTKPELGEEDPPVNLLDHYTALLLAVFVHCGLIKSLSDLVQDSSDLTLKRKGALLLGEVLKFANFALPSNISASLQVMPGLLASASQEMMGQHFTATGMIYQIDSVNRTLYRSSLASKAPASSITKSHELGQPMRPIGTSKPKLSIDLDEVQFRQYILDTQVLSTPSWNKWRWDLINDLIEGPLLNPKRLDDAIKATKFLKRLTTFYRPFKWRFADIRNTKPNQRYVRTGCALMKTLLHNPEGVTFLAEGKLMRQIAECVAHLDRMSGLTSSNPIFTSYRLSETLTGGYFSLIGALSSDPKGITIIERWRLINMFYHILELDDRDDLLQHLLSNMDYSLDSHLRVMLSKALTACSKAIRIFSTRLLRKYATVTPEDEAEYDLSGRWSWAIKLLVTQLYDPEIEVCEVAIQILEEACNRRVRLEYVVQCRPALDHLGEIGAPLLLRFLSTSLGYRYLDGLEYITQEMDDWFLGRNESYVTVVEASLSRALSVPGDRPKSSSDDHFMRAQEYGVIPPHFYRELTRTSEGCRLLGESGHFGAFVGNVKESWSEQDDSDIMLKVKGCLWAIGHVGSMDLGAPFLEETDVVSWIIKIATQSEVMTMRGTAFFVLGLISRSVHGLEILAEYGWSVATDSQGRSLGYCLPPDLSVLFSINLRTPSARTDVRRMQRQAPKLSTVDEDPVNARILSQVVDLGNTVVTKKAASELYSIKAKTPERFNSVHLFRRVMLALETQNVRLGIRRFVLDLFDKSVLRRVVLEVEIEDDIAGRPHSSRR